ncbi:hypothetical protein BJX99DRAFT_216812 [Aspergillus californicus]
MQGLATHLISWNPAIAPFPASGGAPTFGRMTQASNMPDSPIGSTGSPLITAHESRLSCLPSERKNVKARL